MKKIAFYSPYFPNTIGGGERVFLTTAEILSKEGCRVVIVVDKDKKIPQNKKAFWQEIEKKLQLNLQDLEIVNGPFGVGSSLWQRLWFSRKFDSFFYMTDGSLFFSLAKRNIVHFQIPIKKNSNGWLQNLKLKNWGIKTANSLFTKNIIEKNWQVKIDFIQRGCIDLTDFGSAEKEKLIVTVGRFFSPSFKKHCKKQLFLVKTFLKLLKIKRVKDWNFYVIGGKEREADNLAYFDKVKKLAETNKLVKVKADISFNELKSDYARAGIYWHGAGFGVDEDLYPQAVEHFGISVLEAMISGCVPVVVNRGGLKEIVDHGKNGFVYDTEDQLINYTFKLIKDKDLRVKMAKQAVLKAKQFNKTKYVSQVKKIFAL